MTEQKNFWEWYVEISEKEGNLVTPATAAKMLGTSRQYIEKLANAKRLKKHCFDNLPFIGMKDINKEIIRRQQKRLKLITNPAYIELLPEINKLEDEIAQNKEQQKDVLKRICKSYEKLKETLDTGISDTELLEIIKDIRDNKV
jgi:hypothetical protein